MGMLIYFDLDRRFVHRPEYDPHEIVVSYIHGKRSTWTQLLENRFVVIVAPANYGKSTEMVQQVKRMRLEGRSAVFVALRKVAVRGGFERALEPAERSAYEAWKSTPTVPLTIFVDSLDEASASARDGIADLLAEVAKDVDWPNGRVRWVISTRPAVLSADVLENLTQQLINSYEMMVKPRTGRITPADLSSETTAIVTDAPSKPETLLLFSLAPLDNSQAKAYLTGRNPSLDIPEVLRIAGERGLGGFATSPGGLDVLANMELLENPPDSLTEVFQRVVDTVQERQRRDTRIEDAGGAGSNGLAAAAQKLASASQICQLPNIELADGAFSINPDALSVRKIASGMLPDRILQQLLNTELFIDSALNQVKIYPDEISPFLAAQRLAGLVQSQAQAHKIVEHFTWQAPTGEHGVYRQFLPLLGWLATLNHHCREEILIREPQALAFFGDLRSVQVPLAAAGAALRESIRRLVEDGDRLGRGMFTLTSENFWQAAAPRLIPLVNELFTEYGHHYWARDALLEIAIAGRSEILRSRVLRDHGNSYAGLISKTIDMRYILELGDSRDLAGLADVVKADERIEEGIVSTLMTRLAWNHLSARDLADLVDRQFRRGRGGFSVSYAIDANVVENATDTQLYTLSRALIVRLVRLHERAGHRGISHAQSLDRYVDVVAKTMAALLLRPSFRRPKRLLMLCLVVQRFLINGYISTSSSSEMRRAIQTHSTVRFDLLKSNVQRAGKDHDKLKSAIYTYEFLADLTLGDLELLDNPDLNAVVREQEILIAAHRAKQKPAGRLQTEPLKVSLGAAKELSEMLSGLRDGTAENGLAWVAGWLTQTNPGSHYGDIRYELFEQAIEPRISEAVREGFARVWRNRAPAFNESEPRSTHHITVAGLQGLHLELGDGKSLPQLTDHETKRAIQYGAFEINGYPVWFWPVVNTHQEVAGLELVEMVGRANAGAVSAEHAEAVLTSLSHAPSRVQAMVAPLAWTFIIDRPAASDYVLEKLLQAVAGVPGGVPPTQFEETALTKMRTAFENPEPKESEAVQADRTRRKQGAIWGATYLTANAAAFCEAVECWYRADAVTAQKFIFELAAYLGTDHGARSIGLAKSGNDGVRALGIIYAWTLEVVRPEDDIEHPYGESYSPVERDHAERFRDQLIPAIAASKSQLGYEILENLRRTAVGPTRTYLLNVQFEMREAQFARPALAQQKYNDFERDFTADVTDTVSFAMKVHSDLLAVKYAIEKGEYSLRRFFTEIAMTKHPVNKAEGDKEGLALEADFQSLLASELNHYSTGTYSVTVEPHTAESKRRDVLCSKGDMFASIELKMSMRWTIDKYKEALEMQLVGQYMHHRNATTGFLVIVLQQEGRTWVNPETGRRVDFNGLLAMLREQALQLEAKDRTRYLRVIGIDATKPKNFRTESKKVL